MPPTTETTRTTSPNLPTEPIRIGATVLEMFDTNFTCWLFDRRRRRFLVLPSQTEVDPGVFELPWRHYEELEPTSDGRGLVVRPIGDAVDSIYVLAP